MLDASKQQIDLSNMSKAETLLSIVKAYEEEYLSNCNIERKGLSDDEIILVVEDEFIVGFFLSPHSFGELISGNVIENSDYWKARAILKSIDLIRQKKNSSKPLFTFIDFSIAHPRIKLSRIRSIFFILFAQQ